MTTLSIIYWSGTGNTEGMANAIAEGARNAGANVTLIPVSQATTNDVFNADIVALGCPAMGAEELEDTEMEPFVTSLKDEKLQDKPMILFGSYDWGDGEWMEEWEKRMTQYGAKIIADSVILQGYPSSTGIEKCQQFGKQIVTQPNH
ncbi:flavodoxin [Desulfuribacillus stibiiarsenatis]|uniref:Flavodoxin n=1 Tax=Desulfuribacillus stibiiarsenatis TaxID=1390249 RepID=A0A1E5L3G7_9FIRM|nr:flavodoxin [Desulfuribacillus stibiiarsenatis]OEH84647.1 flavodoxin [Desulfuribacillus stibiiarsenatis]